MSKRRWTEERRAQHAAAMRAYWTPERCAERKAERKAKATAEFKARVGEATKRALAAPEVRKKISEGMRERWTRIAYRQKVVKHLDKIRATSNTPTRGLAVSASRALAKGRLDRYSRAKEQQQRIDRLALIRDRAKKR